MSRNHTKDKRMMIDRLSRTPIVEVACKQAEMPRSTYYRWRKADAAFAEACDEALEQSANLINDMAESQLIAAIKERNMTAIIFWLKHHHRSYRARLEINANVRSEQQALTPEQTVMVTEALRLAGLMRLPDGEQSGPE